MDHPVAVRAEQGEITDSASAFAANVQWLDMVAFDVALAPFAVELAEVELAHLAGQRSASTRHTLDLLPPQSGISLPVGVPA
jgi:hypothetical protein